MEQIMAIRSTLRSGHHTGTAVNNTGLTLTEDVRGESGRVEISDTRSKNVKVTVKFKKEYVNPVVVAYIVTRAGGQSVECRVNDVTPSECSVFIEDPNDASHNAEFVGYIVLEAGSHITLSGYRIEAGLHETTTVRKGGTSTFTGDTIKFDKLFTKKPIILHSLNSHRNNTFATTMVQKVTVEGFEISQEVAETKKISANEKLAWIAFEPMVGKGFLTEAKGEVGVVTSTEKNTGVDDTPTTIDFKAGFTTRPDIVVKGQTMNGSDGYWSRGAGAWSKDLVKVYAEEDQKTDTERSHPTETFGFAAFEPGTAFKTVRSYGDRVSDIFQLGALDIRYPLITTWSTTNYSKTNIDAKYSADFGINWSDWIPCNFGKPVPGLPVTGSLSGYSVQFKYTVISDVEVLPCLSEFNVTTDEVPVIIEGLNVGGYATDGTDWNIKRIL